MSGVEGAACVEGAASAADRFGETAIPAVRAAAVLTKLRREMLDEKGVFTRGLIHEKGRGGDEFVRGMAAKLQRVGRFA